ncbi:MAG: PQQ-dependent sugar dehydrogenase [Deltaproteobacteria bacterium]|nr:PQQ-dependent sugar dehydrogenase [Deltaproteobacteria bacterium]
MDTTGRGTGRAAGFPHRLVVVVALLGLGCDGCGCDGVAVGGDGGGEDGEGGDGGDEGRGDGEGGDGEGGDGEGGDGEGGDGAVVIDSCFGPASAAVDGAAVPDGFCAWTWADGLSAPRGIKVAPNGDVLVIERGSNRVMVLFDEDGDGTSGPGERAVVAAASGLNHGIALRDGYLYASSATTVWRWAYPPGARTELGVPETVVRDIPAGGHSTRTLAFDAEGRLYVSVGSGSNVDPDFSRARVRRFVVGSLPAGGLAFDGGEAFADGLRNEVGLAFDGAGRLWGVENGIDELHRADLGGDIHQDNPGEELNLFDVAGRFYGYPYCWSEFLLPVGTGLGPGAQWADPGFLGDGTHDDAWCRDPANVVPPSLVLPAHTAPLGLVFYDGPSFPDGARGDAFVALHGSWNRDVPIGYKVVRVFFEGGDRPLRWESFFEYGGPGDRAAEWTHRPVDVALGSRGELLVTSDASGVIIAIGYTSLSP